MEEPALSKNPAMANPSPPASKVHKTETTNRENAKCRKIEMSAEDGDSGQGESTYALTTRGWAICVPAALTFKKIVARPPNSKSWIEEVKVLREQEKAVTRPQLKLQENETPKEFEDDAERCIYLVVGITTLDVLEDLGAKIKDFPPGCKKGKAVGDDMVDGDILVVSETEIVLVVCPEQDDRSKATQLYALVGPQEGICAAHPIDQDQVFYYPQFRDDCGDISKRNLSWNQLIQAQRIPLPQKFTPKVVFELEPSLMADILFQWSLYDHTGDFKYLQNMKDILRKAESDLGPPPADFALRKLLNNTEPNWCEEDSNNAFTQFRNLFPSVECLSPNDFAVIKQQLGAAKLHVPYQLLCNFVMEAAIQLEELRNSGADESTAAKTALTTTQRHADFGKPAMTRSERKEWLVMHAMGLKLQQISEAGKRYQEDALDEGFNEIWEKSGHGEHTDTRLVASQLSSLAVGVIAEKHRRTGEAVGDMVKELKEAKMIE